MRMSKINAFIRKAVALIIVFMMILTGCRSGNMINTSVDNSISDNDRDKSILIWAWDETFNVKAAQMAAEEYKITHPGVSIMVETKEREEILSDTQNILSAKLYDRLPDIMMMEDYDVQDVLSRYDDEFVELNGLIDYSKFVDYKVKLCSRDGKYYGIPFDSGTAGLFYRIDILNQAGYTEDDMRDLTWDEFIKIGRNVYERTGLPMVTLDPTDLPLARIVMQSCGEWYVDSDGVTVNIRENEPLRKSLEIYEELLESDVGVAVNGWNEFISAFQTGKVAGVVSGGWIISSIKAADSLDGLWRVAPIPYVEDCPNAVNASNVGGSAWYILKNGRNVDAATEFAVSMFGNNDEFMDRLISEIGIIPAVRKPEVFDHYRTGDSFFGGQQVTKLLCGLAYAIPTVNYGSKTYEIEEILEEEFQDALIDGDYSHCLERAQMKAESITKE